MGHDNVQQLVNDNLPNNIKNNFSEKQLKKLKTHYSHFPDSFENFDESEVGDYAIELLKKQGIKNRYHLHRPKGIAVSFVLLIESLKKADYERSIIWIGSLGHSMADEASVNHDPLIHYLTYNLWTYNLKDGQDFNLKKLLPYLDLTKIAEDENGKKLLAESLKNNKPSIISEHAEEAILYILLRLSCTYPTYESERDSSLIRYIKEGIIENNPGSMKKYIESMRDLACLSAKDIINTVTTADYLAEKNSEPAIDYETLLKIFGEKLTESYKIKPLSCELYTAFTKGASTEGGLGIIVEPFYSFSKGFLSPLWRYMAPALAIACEKRNIKYSLLDVRDIYENGFPDPQKVPLCILDVGEFNSFMWIKKGIFEEKAKKYCERGGHLIWIGGNISTILGMDKFMTACNPAEKTYSGISGEKISSAKLLLTGTFNETLKGKYVFANSPETKEGWCRPYCSYKLDKYDELYMQLELNGNKIPISGKFGNIIFIPEYAISPYLIDNSYDIKGLEKPSLDKFSEEIIINAIYKLK
ncbi:MAG: hypothetical protein A2020_11325 [Lentisphaerae bacterium GWF2_45_14]|nr:MAG: hypothetical protein A2020_11325 [Lentisphaerae bacterium GWF2_45_14]